MCNNAAVAADGTVWFSDSSTRYGFDHWQADLLERSGSGRLIRRDPDGGVGVVRPGAGGAVDQPARRAGQPLHRHRRAGLGRPRRARNPTADRLVPLPGLLRQLVWALPPSMRPPPPSQVWVLAVDPDTGHVVHDLQGAHPEFGVTTGVREHHGTVWLGSIRGTSVACFTIPADPG